MDQFLTFGEAGAETIGMPAPRINGPRELVPTERAWFNPRPEANNPPTGRGMIDEQGRLHTWPSNQADHAQMARDRGVRIAHRLFIYADGTVVSTGGPMPPSEALARAIEQDPRLRPPDDGDGNAFH